MEGIFQATRSAIAWFGVPPDITAWEFINSEFIVTVLIGMLGWFLNRKVRHLPQRIAERTADERKADDLRTKFEQLGTGSETVTEEEAGASADAAGAAPPTAPAAPAGRVPGRRAGRRNTLQYDTSLVVSEAKRFIVGRLDKQTDPRKKRFYDSIPENDHRLKVMAALDDRLITSEQARDLFKIFNTWKSHVDQGKVISQKVLQEMQVLMGKVKAVRDGLKGAGARQVAETVEGGNLI